MEFATTALRILLPRLSQLLRDEYNLQAGTRKGIEYLYQELERIQATLSQVGEVPHEQLTELLRLWARDLKDVSYDMDDILDTFMVDVEGPDPPSKSRVKEFMKNMLNIEKAKNRRKVAKEIKNIKQRVTEVAERRDRYNLGASITPTNRTLVDPRIGALYTKVTQLVGIGKAKEQVIARLIKGDAAEKQERVEVSIAGFGGLGKTTLAKAVYDEIKGQFDCAAFVSVSRSPDPKKLLKDMLYELHNRKEQHPGASLEGITQLIDLVREFLQSKRYLIVIDDIWEKDPWDNVIEHALIDNKLRSRIITTTRNIDVAEHVGGCYRLEPLSYESSERLFFGRIFGSDSCPDENFSTVSTNILNKCGGVPLAIITTSSLLAEKKNIGEWDKVCNSIGSGLCGSNASMANMTKILLLSYYDLPPHLKTCLLYLSMFPEDYQIGKDGLIWRWVAEGFVQQAGDQSFLEAGESYFNELVNRSLIQPVGMRLDGTPHGCRVHDSVLDLIISLSKEECLITTTTAVLGDGVENKVRRLCLHGSSSTSWPAMSIMPKLRSLAIITPGRLEAIDSLPSQLSRYHLLRVLDLRNCSLKGLGSLGFVRSLSHLRYLGLRTNTEDTDRLPAEIGELRFLQTLDLGGTKVRELPSSIVGRLRKLIRLHGSILYTKLPDGGLKNLIASLEVLKLINVTSKCVAEDLGRLTQLRVLDRLRVDGDGDEREEGIPTALVESLGRLKRIEYVHIDCYSASPLCLDGGGKMKEPLAGSLRRLLIRGVWRVPTWIRDACLPNLSYLNLNVEYERRQDIQVLGTLTCLRHLKFEVRRWRHKIDESVIMSPVEPDSVPGVKRCAVEPGAFPRVESCEFKSYTLHIYVADFLSADGGGTGAQYTVDDLALSHLPSLERVTVLTNGEYNRIRSRVEECNRIRSRVEEKLEQERDSHPKKPRIDVNPRRTAGPPIKFC